jgi:hypothetical protein
VEKMAEHNEDENNKGSEFKGDSEDTENVEELTTLFAVRTTINQESNILQQIFYRFKILEVVPDIRAMLVSPLLPGYIFFGVFEGARAIVMRMPHDTSSSEEVVVRLLQEETPITIKIHGDYLKLVEKKKPEEEREPIPEVKVSAAQASTDLEKAISFDEEYDEDEEYQDQRGADKSDEYYDEEEDLEDEDEWSKFDGF